MKILITGVLGYIARSLCELYKDSEHEVIGVDSNFTDSGVEWLVNNNIKYYHRDIFNIRDLLKDADLIYHFAGLTLVPMTLSQSNPVIDAEITRIGTDGTREIINYSKPDAKIIFTSSHIVFEGLTKETFDIDENATPCPILAYGKSKYTSEIDLQNSGKSYLIARLASVYSANRATRWRILPNLFSKMTAANQDLKVFGSNNYKPLVGVKDVADALVYLVENDHNKEIFNIVNDVRTVRQVAEICQKVNPKIKIIETNDETPNKGYTTSNKKLLATGFKFKQDIDTEIADMIGRWRNKG